MAGRNSTAQTTVIFALTLAILLAALDGTIVATALPSIADDLGAADGYAWVGSAYFLAVTALLPLWGNLSDAWGRKTTILLANGVFFIGSLVCGLAATMGMLIAGRTVQGAGAAGLVILVNIILSDLFPIKERAKYMGITNTSWAIAAAIGPLVGGAFAQNVSWRWCFYLNLPLGGVVFGTLLVSLHIDQQRASLLSSLKTIDWIGLVLLIAGTLMLLLGLQLGANNSPWSSASVLCLLIFGILTMISFILAEWHLPKLQIIPRPILPITLFSTRSPLSILLCYWIHGIIGVAPYYYLPYFFQVARDATPILSGVYILPMVLTAALSTIATGILAEITGRIVEPIWVGFALTTLGLGLYVDFDENSPWSKLVIYQLIFGLGLGPNYAAPLIAAQRVVHPQDIAVMTSAVAFSRQFGSSLTLVVGGVILQSELQARRGSLVAGLGADLAGELLQAGEGVPSRHFMNSLTDLQRDLVRAVYADSIRPMYYVYVALSGVAFLVGFLIARDRLQDAPVLQTTESGQTLTERVVGGNDEPQASSGSRNPNTVHLKSCKGNEQGTDY